MDNYGILDRQLQETYGEKIADLNHAQSRSRTALIRLRKLNTSPLVVRQIVRSVVPTEARTARPLRLTAPTTPEHGLQRMTLDIAEQAATERVLKEIGETITIATLPGTLDVYAAATELCAVYRLELWEVLGELKRLYPTGELPASHLPDFARQIEALTRRYEVREEIIERALALVRPEGFEKGLKADGTAVYTAEISYPVEREGLLVAWEQFRDKNTGDFGFHYSPYNFDSRPEFSFFELLLEHLNVHASDVEDVYFTGALTTPDKTDFYVEYWGEDAKWHRYTPDFILLRKDGRYYIVEIKREHDREHPIDGERGRKALAMQKWADLNPDRLKYQMIFTSAEALGFDDVKAARDFVEGQD
jgi:hypothetical protein